MAVFGAYPNPLAPGTIPIGSRVQKVTGGREGTVETRFLDNTDEYMVLWDGDRVPVHVHRKDLKILEVDLTDGKLWL